MIVRNRAGYSLPEMLVSLVVVGIIGAALAQVMTVQSRFLQTQEGRGAARAVSRSATNMVLTDLRMVEEGGGVLSASNTSITLRVPYQFGMVCENDLTTMTAAMLPVDSVVLAEAGHSGYAWRNSAGTYNYVETATTIGTGNASTCTANNITPTTGGRILTFTPAPLLGAPEGTPIFMFQRITYSFAASVSVPGQTGLWRTVVASSLAEELAAPFHSSASFAFFVDGSATAQTTVPSPLSNIRGLELRLTGINERAGNTNAEEQTPYTTAVFFKNRL